MTDSTEQQIFKNSSVTYYWSSKFFPAAVRADVYRLYSFVRLADDYVDSVPPQSKEFFALKTAWKTGELGGLSEINQTVIKNMAVLVAGHKFDTQWVSEFLEAMESDLLPIKHRTLKDSLHYTHGSAEVVGLMMSQIMKLPYKAEKYAALQGRAMQWINFIRDVAEDNALGRSYFPRTDLQKFGLKDLSQHEANQHPEAFTEFIRFQIARYKQWQAQAEKGYPFIPRRMLVPLKTAVTMYDWTARKIEKDPFIVFEKKIKPSKFRVLSAAMWNFMHG